VLARSDCVKSGDRSFDVLKNRRLPSEEGRRSTASCKPFIVRHN